MKTKIIDILTHIVGLAFLAFLIALCWVGAEYVFDGAVHFSNTDNGIAVILSGYMIRDIIRIEKKLTAKTNSE